MASTYVNDLRLNEMATGDQSGSWGTVTNTNLELIAEAFSFGTEGITTNADTHTTTIADGATDPGRSMFLKYTGTLDSACTITIEPNTVSKLWFIENGTSGSQNIIISQGSGANITIPPGDTKAIYSDGAGSGAAMVDAFASLSVVDLKVQDDLTVTDDVAIGGLATVGGTLGVTGILTTTAEVVLNGGAQINAAVNVGVDDQGYDFKFFGDTASRYMRWDSSSDSLLFTDDSKIQMGNGSDFLIYHDPDVNIIEAATSNQDIVFKGNDGGSTVTALTLDMSAAGTAIFNSHIDLNDDKQIFWGNGTTGIQGDAANGELTFFTSNVTTYTIPSDGAMFSTTLGTSNLRFGVNAGDAILSGGNYNVCVGDEAGTAITTGDNNTVVGYQALDAEDTGGNSTAIGHKALSSQNNDDLNTYNTAVGSEAAITLTAGIQNVFVGGQAAKFATTTTSSTFVGHKAGLGIEGTPLTGNNNTAIGQQAGLLLQGTAASNTLVGATAGDNITTGDSNIIIGSGIDAQSATADGQINIGGIFQYDGTDITLDAAGTIILDGDAAGATVYLKDAGLHWGSIFRSDSNFNIESEASDTDIVFKGNDGGSDITPVVFDMSSGGSAIFSGSVAGNNIATQLRNINAGADGDAVSQWFGLARDGGLIFGNAGEIKVIKEQDWTTTSSTIDAAMVFSTQLNETLTEHMRLFAAGNIAIGSSGNGDISGTDTGGCAINNNGGIQMIDSRTTDTGTTFRLRFFNGTADAAKGSISTNGDATTFSTSSDYRLKENVDYDWDATTRLKQLKPARFNWITDDTNTLVDGFLAHEAATVVPNAVVGEKDATEQWLKCVLNAAGDTVAKSIEEADWTAGKSATTDADGNTVAAKYASDTTWVATKDVPMMQSIDHSFMVPLLVKTIQELEARITALEA